MRTAWWTGKLLEHVERRRRANAGPSAPLKCASLRMTAVVGAQLTRLEKQVRVIAQTAFNTTH
jgi:hypothetical protein